MAANPSYKSAPPLQAASPSRPVTYWAILGAVLLVFQFYVLGKWVLGPNFVATDPGSDPLPAWQATYFMWLQIIVPLGMVVCLYFWVVRPWLREGRLTTDAMLALSGVMIFFWDMCMNYTSVALFYNSHMVNRGAWANGAWPGWTSPNAQLLPEPILVTVPGYTCLVFSQVILVCWMLRKAKQRWPQLSVAAIIALMIVSLTCIDSCIEILLVRSGVYAYPGGIRELTLFAGETYQFPLTEGFLFGGLGLGSIAVLNFFRDDKGRTLVERGLETMRISSLGKQWVKFLAIFGFCHGMFFLLYMVPNQWLSTHSDPFPQGYPSYMINGMCVSGAAGNQCPAPGIPMPRPQHNPF
jgi:Spirocyclase AveC-like